MISCWKPWKTPPTREYKYDSRHCKFPFFLYYVKLNEMTRVSFRTPASTCACATSERLSRKWWSPTRWSWTAKPTKVSLCGWRPDQTWQPSGRLSHASAFLCSSEANQEPEWPLHWPVQDTRREDCAHRQRRRSDENGGEFVVWREQIKSYFSANRLWHQCVFTICYFPGGWGLRHWDIRQHRQRGGARRHGVLSLHEKLWHWPRPYQVRCSSFVAIVPILGVLETQHKNVIVVLSPPVSCKL